jgi:AcrR family transcriptional regulator
MYRLIPTKADLFKGVISDRLERFLLAIDAESLDRLPLEQALERILIAFGELALSEDAIWVHRVVLGETRRFPELAATFAEAVQRRGDAIAAWLRRQCHRGLIALEDVQVASGMLRGMMIMELQHAIMLGQQALPEAAEIAERARTCARLFLEGCRHR